MAKTLLLPETDSHYRMKFDPTKYIIKIECASDCELHRGGTADPKDDDIDDVSKIIVYNRTKDEHEKQEILWECYACDNEDIYPKLLVKVAKYIAKNKGAFK